MTSPAPSVVAALEAPASTTACIVHTAPVRSLAEAAAARGVDVVDVVKTLVVRRGDGDYLFVLVPGRPSDLVAEAARPARRSRGMSMPPAAEAFEATGFDRGTITPLGSSTAWPVVADVVRGRRGEITLGRGRTRWRSRCRRRPLSRRRPPIVADVTEPE